MGLIGEVERLNNTFLSEKNQIKKEKEDKKQTQQALFNYFYKQFKKSPHNFENIYINLQYINKREKIINKLSIDNMANIQYINLIYTKTLKEVYNIFKNNYKYLQLRESEEIENIEEVEEVPEEKKQLNWPYFWETILKLLLFPLFVILGCTFTYDKQARRKRRG